MAINYRLLDALRRGRTDIENHLIDGLVRGTARARALAAAEISPVYGDLAEPEIFRAEAEAAKV